MIFQETKMTDNIPTFDPSKIIFCSYCFGNAYLLQQIRLKESILRIYPDANLYFINESEITGKPKFQKSLYGFKVQLVKHCRSLGFRKIVFFDTAITLTAPIDHWFDIIKGRGVLAGVDRSKLNKVTSNSALHYVKLSRELVSEWNLVGGSVYVFDFDEPKCREIFHLWEEMERDGIFGTQDDLSHDRLQSHRMDETCMALSMCLNGIAPLGHDVMRYCYEHPDTHAITGNEANAIVKKVHFK